MTSLLRRFTIAISALFLISIYTSCNSGNNVQVTANFENEIEQQQNLEFTLSKDVCPDSMLNKWDSSVFLELNPAVKGMFKWSMANTIVFSPAGGFAPGTEYKAIPTSQLLKYGGKKYGIDKKPIVFHTAPLRVNTANLMWTRAANQADVVVRLDMSFNYDINLAQAAGKVTLSKSGSPISIVQASTGNGRMLSLLFNPDIDKDQEIALSVTIGKGIGVTGSQYESERDSSFTLIIPSRYNLAITGAIAQHTGTEGLITVTTSQPILDKNLKKAISIQPAVPFEIAINESGFTITGNSFNPAQIYEMSVSPEIEGAFGGRLKSGYSTSISFGVLRPSVSFNNSKGMYLTGQGYKNISLSIINVPAVEVTVVKVFENNLEQFLRRDLYYDYHYDRETEEGSSYEYYETDNLGDEVYKKVFETSKLPRQNAAHILHLDFEDRLKNYNGVYVLQVKSKEHNWIQQSKIISISDIGLIVKEEQDNIYVFANSIHTAEALSDVSVSFVSTTNQKLYTVKTDGNGLAVFKGMANAAPGFHVGMVTAKKDEDFTFIWFDKTKIGTSRFDVGGRIPNQTGLVAMIHPERNLYRPGEAIHLGAIVRNEQWQPQAEMPVKIKLVMPNGKEFATMRKVLNEQGSCEVTFAPPQSTMTGTYIAQVYTGNDVLLNAYNISVEDFMPDRLKVSLKTDKTEYKPGEKVIASIQADNLYGTPAANKNYQCELRLTKGTFSSDKYSDYDFAINNELRIDDVLKEAKTNDKGAATQTFDLNGAMTDAGVVNGNITATVFDETGRPLHRFAHFSIYTQPYFVGIRSKEEYVSSRTPIQLGLICLDKNGNIQSSEAEVVVVKKEWNTVIQKSGNSYRYVSQSDERIVSRQKITIAGAGTHFTFSAPQSGEYEVRVFVKGAGGYVAQRLYAYGWGDTQYSSFEVNNEGNVEIKTDKKQYNIGDKVDVLFNAPFEGKMLVTLERDKIIKHYYLQTKNKSASLTFDAGEDLLPNVYIAATLFRPMDGSDMPLTVAHGFKSVPVTGPKYQLPVDITVAEKSRSKTKQMITVKTEPGAYVTIAAVDEGILQIKNFATPDPYGFFYQKIALTVNGYDVYPWLLPEIKTTLSTTGGDGSGYDGSRINPLFVNRIKNVSFWSGILQADGNGRVKYEIDIPQFSGDIRVMALAHKNKSFGSGDKHIKVADPVVISVALPRFLSPGDEMTMPISVSNTTGKSATATVTVKTTGQVKIAGSATQEIELPANSEQRAVFHVTAQPATGIAQVSVSVKAMNETFTNETDLSIRPPASLQKVTGNGFAAAGKTTAIDFRNTFIPASFAGKITVGKSPLMQFSKHLDDLVRYPYGCVEQTTSAAFPQLYYADLVKSIVGYEVTDKNPTQNVQQAINKLQSMQMGDGGLSYWPQGGEVSWWGSVYACHFLLEARKAGFEVNAHTISRLQDFMKYRLYQKELITFFYNGHNKKNVAPEEIPYSLYVLALSGQPQLSEMNYYKAHHDLLTLNSKYLLAGAYSLSGMPGQAGEILPPAFTGEIADQCLSGSFYSYLRDLALSLNVLMDTDPGNKQVGIMARQLSEQLAKARYTNTQEKAFSILALGKVAKRANQTTGTATITAGGKAIGTTPGAAITTSITKYAMDAIALNVTGNGGFYYNWEISGISADGSYKEEDSYIRVRRSFMDRNGHELGTSFRQNDLLVVHITLEAQHNGTIENVAITDMLPAGFEVENTRLSALPEMDWIKKRAVPEYIDIRDDRVNMFTSATQQRKDFYYMVRAVSPGTYKLGPVQADAMYDGSYHSYNGACTIRINE
jgi:alpha-2-macroglobulin